MKRLLGLVLGLLLLASPINAEAQDAIDLGTAGLQCGSPVVFDRVSTATMTGLTFRADGVVVEFTKKFDTTTPRWPDVTPPGWDGPLQYTLWLGMRNGAEWNVAGLIEYWYGLEASGGNVILDNQILKNWTYDCGPMARQPAAGEPVAFFVTAGSQRKKDVFLVRERSNVVVVPFPGAVPTHYNLNTSTPIPTPVPDPMPTPTPTPLPDISARLDAIATNLGRIEAKVEQVGVTVTGVKSDVAEGRKENQEFYQAVGVRWKKVTSFVGKYIAPAIAAFIVGKQL